MLGKPPLQEAASTAELGERAGRSMHGWRLPAAAEHCLLAGVAARRCIRLPHQQPATEGRALLCVWLANSAVLPAAPAATTFWSGFCGWRSVLLPLVPPSDCCSSPNYILPPPIASLRFSSRWMSVSTRSAHSRTQHSRRVAHPLALAPGKAGLGTWWGRRCTTCPSTCLG